MSCLFCNNKSKLPNEDDTYKKSFFYKIILFLIGILIVTVIVPIEYFLVFSIVFLNKGKDTDLLNVVSKVFNLKKKN